METSINQNTILTLHNILGVNRKIVDQVMRIKYLREVWGLDQKTIALCEEISQASVSKILQESKFSISSEELGYLPNVIKYEPEEIELLQKLPRDLIADVPLISFVNNILRLNPNHSFYLGFTANTNLRIAALSSIGIQNKHLQKMFNRSQPNISMIIKRNIVKALTIERYQRYDVNLPLTFSTVPFGGLVWNID